MGNSMCCKEEEKEPNIEIIIKDINMCDDIECNCLSTCCIKKDHKNHNKHHTHKENK